MKNYHLAALKYQLVILFFILTGTAQASEYVIKFQEGAFDFQPSKKFDHLDNKYLSKVTVKKDGEVVAEVKGSTLPDGATFYTLWHESGQLSSPSDNDVFKLFEDARTNRSRIQQIQNAALIPYDFLEFMFEWSTYTPVVYSGLYKFSIGLHQEGTSVHGKPYVPKLYGADKVNPFSGKDGYQQKDWEANLRDGGFVKSITYNKMNGANVADGINIHDGRISGSQRDSGGCLTINPNYWQKFYQSLPDAKSWVTGKHVGYVVIIRKGEDDLECKVSKFCTNASLSAPKNMSFPPD